MIRDEGMYSPLREYHTVIGCNYGDEGKGLVTDYIASKSTTTDGSIWVHRTNGGAQAGHTVHKDGKRYVLNHLSSASLTDTEIIHMFGADFIINPHIFLNNLDIVDKYRSDNKMLPLGDIVFDPKCRITTPFAILRNRLLEECRGTNKHGSCGLGIYETTIEENPYRVAHIKSIISNLDVFRNEELYKFINWYKTTIAPDKVSSYRELLKYCRMLMNWCDEFMIDLMCFNNRINEREDFYTKRIEFGLKSISPCIFEMAQGLALDKDNLDDYPHLTPSNTGMETVNEFFKDIMHSVGEDPYEYSNNIMMNVHLVTRGYFTRHGAGPFKEIDTQPSTWNIVDETNTYNDFQGSIRVGYFDVDAFTTRVNKLVAKMDTDKLFPNRKFVVHMNFLDQTNGVLYTDQNTFYKQEEILELLQNKISTKIDIEFHKSNK